VLITPPRFIIDYCLPHCRFEFISLPPIAYFDVIFADAI